MPLKTVPSQVHSIMSLSIDEKMTHPSHVSPTDWLPHGHTLHSLALVTLFAAGEQRVGRQRAAMGEGEEVTYTRRTQTRSEEEKKTF